MKLTLEFDLPAEKVEASAASQAMDLVCTLNEIDERARACLKYESGDPRDALADIRSIVADMLGRIE